MKKGGAVKIFIASCALASLALATACTTNAAGFLDGLLGYRKPDREAIEEARALVDIPLPSADGAAVYESDGFTVDSSNAGEGYVMVRGEPVERPVKVMISLGEDVYYYDLETDGEYNVFSLPWGSGRYEVRIMERVSGSSYAMVCRTDVDVALRSEFSPFLYPCQYVDYDADSDAVAWGYVLSGGARKEADVVDTLYSYVADTTRYDTEKAASVSSGYIPNVDDTLWSQMGICFDYASLLATMLRTQRIPTQLVFGYVGPEDQYHAWTRVYTGGRWRLMDATLDDGRADSAYIQTANF